MLFDDRRRNTPNYLYYIKCAIIINSLPISKIHYLSQEIVVILTKNRGKV